MSDHWHKNPKQNLILFLKTYDINFQVPDSAATASAIYSGVKTMGATMGFDSSVFYIPFTLMENANKVKNIAKYAQDAGMDTGAFAKTMFLYNIVYWHKI